MVSLLVASNRCGFDALTGQGWFGVKSSTGLRHRRAVTIAAATTMRMTAPHPNRVLYQMG